MQNPGYMTKINNMLKAHYEGFPFDLESEEPDVCIRELIDQINRLHQSSSRDMSNEMKYRYIDGVAHLPCFTYRAARKTDGQMEYWNALHQSFADFKDQNTIIYQADAPFPTTDMIKAWCMSFASS